MIRKCKFSGKFYQKNKNELKKQIVSYLDQAKISNIKTGISYVSPHAGYIYSGKTAAYTYKALSINKNLDSIDTIIIIGPNHTGYGADIAVSFEDWETPFSILKNNKQLSEELTKFSNIKHDEIAHINEHSIEVQLPFLSVIAPNKKYCFISMLDQSLSASIDLSNAIFDAAKKINSKIIIIASSDFNHYESADIANAKDTKLINALEYLDYKKFNELVFELNDSACGIGAIVTSLLIAKKQGAKKGKLLHYSNSSNETQDYSDVVAYASLVFI